ncbi:MAG: hypothetical protein HUU19_11315 [Phycisphaerales bacterium]|jgi:hypothetical protein|nr:hypothetical protein [Phycisphaerales bacterium]
MTPIRTLLILAAASAMLAQGCTTSKHDVAKAQAGQVSVCTRCYDQIRKVRSTGGPRGGLATHRTITTHMCEECKDEMTIYEKDGVLMVRCAACAPEGVDCDRCVPKE